MLRLSVSACGPGVHAYQWRRGGTHLVDGGAVSGETTPELTIDPVDPTHTGIYDVVVSTSLQLQAVSQPAIVAVAGTAACAGQGPSIGQQPAGQDVLSGVECGVCGASSGPAGAGALTYQWRRNGVTLMNGGTVSGAGTAGLTISTTTLLENGDAFDCIVSNLLGSIPSDPAGLGVTYRCQPDYNRWGTVSVQDIFDFLSSYFVGCP